MTSDKARFFWVDSDGTEHEAGLTDLHLSVPEGRSELKADIKAFDRNDLPTVTVTFKDVDHKTFRALWRMGGLDVTWNAWWRWVKGRIGRN